MFAYTVCSLLNQSNRTNNTITNTSLLYKDTYSKIHEVRNDLKLIEKKVKITECINLNSFVQALILIALSIDRTFGNEEKVMILFEKMNQSGKLEHTNLSKGRPL
jgi:hypothetical protein